MDILTVPTMPYGCDWEDCSEVFATRDELDAHDRGHWAKEDARNDYLRTTDRHWGYNDTPGKAPASETDGEGE